MKAHRPCADRTWNRTTNRQGFRSGKRGRAWQVKIRRSEVRAGGDYRAWQPVRQPVAYRHAAALRYSGFASEFLSLRSAKLHAVRCPYCQFDHDRVMDSRASEDGYVI